MEKVEDEMETCVNIFQHVELSAVRRKTKPFPDRRRIGSDLAPLDLAWQA